MKLIVGLGNSGKKYEKTRHNVGFMVLDKLIGKDKFVFDKKFNAEIHKTKDVIYIKPQTFMNLSGQAVKKVATFFKIKPQDITVISDDIYLDSGDMRLREKGSSGGHKGLQSIIDELGANDFKRIRIGINMPPEKMNSEDYVLQNFSKEEFATIKNVIEKISKEIISNI